jgi:cyclopropane-fatty-acyl-phospholipid synthase
MSRDLQLRTSSPGDAVVRSLDAWCLERVARGLGEVPIQVQLWDGTAAELSPAPPIATVVIGDRPTLFRLLWRPALEFGEAYSAGRLTVRGDLVGMIVSLNRALSGRPYQRRTPRVPSATRSAARENVHVHYDLGNDFYRLWLDAEMVYTCAYFEHADLTLEAAQRAKLDYVCRKLALQPGDRVIEAGCGWGALAIHMARHYGATVRAYNVSGPQLELARARAAEAGVSDRVTFVNADYRSIDGRCDAFVSIGMLEHVGRSRYGELASIVDRVLDPAAGRGLLHFIGRNRPMEFNPWIARHVFPGAHAPALSEVLPDLESVNLSIVDVENLRLHYAATLGHWRERFQAHEDEIRQRFDDQFARTWRLYLAGAQASFLAGDLQLFQVVFRRPADNGLPWTRRQLYSSAG